jgi:ornithine--oxo-acid transaminase
MQVCLKQTFGYDCVATMVTGSEAAESAVQIARKWAYWKKGIPEGEAWVLTVDRCFHGLTIGTMSLSNVKADCKSSGSLASKPFH